MLKEKLSLVPKKSGCYLMKDSLGTIIYVGKAKNLFNRLKSYFNGRVTGKTKKLVSEIVDFDTIVTTSELEAFILELNLIKKYDPKYNILLKDDKSYPYIELTNDKFPKLRVIRELNIKKKNKTLFGPFYNVGAARSLVNLINRLYPLRKCDIIPKKECLYYHIKECLGYCINANINITNMLKEITGILNGNEEILINKIKTKIEEASNNMNYELALTLKKDLDYISIIFEKQKVELNDGINRDIFNYYYKNGYISIEVFFLRNGKIVEGKNTIIPIINDIKETLEYFIVDFYSKSNILPNEIIVPKDVDVNLLSEILSKKVINTKKGVKHKIFLMVYENAKINLENNINLVYLNEEKKYESNKELKELLNMNHLSVIEAFDNSNLFGSFTVSAMVTFIDGEPSKKDYRKFKMSFEKNDDVSAMKEVIYRRYYKVLINNLRKPDLIVVDGGLNQINACKSILNDLNLNIKVIGLQKNNKHELDQIIDGDTLKSITINKQSNVFYLLNRISDEVHNFVINYHRTIRSKGSISSVLDQVEGIGPKRKKELIKKYGGIKKMKEASIEQLSEYLPLSVSENLYNYLKTI